MNAPPRGDLLADLLAQVREAAREGAAQGIAEGMAASRPAKLDLAELSLLLKKRPGNLRMWLSRHRDFPREKAGRKLLFDRAAVDTWLAAHPKDRG